MFNSPTLNGKRSFETTRERTAGVCTVGSECTHTHTHVHAAKFSPLPSVSFVVPVT